jgi:hypothetical protein
VATQLAALGVTKAELLDVVRAAVGGRRDAISYDPISAGGQFAWIFGTRRLRAIYVSQGWEIDRTNNVESVFNPKAGIKIIYQSAERAGDFVNDPLPMSPKGAGSARVVEMGQLDFWPEMRLQEIDKAIAQSWYLFVYAMGDDVRAELSYPKSIEGEQFHGFHDRIILVGKGEWQGIDITPDDQDLPEFDVNVTRKG